jgi:hypothetical protein
VNIELTHLLKLGFAISKKEKEKKKIMRKKIGRGRG